MLSAEQRIDQTIEAGSGSEGCLRLRNKMTRSGTNCLEFSLEVRQRHIEIEHGHLRRSVAEQFHHGGKTHTGSKHFCRIGMPTIAHDK